MLVVEDEVADEGRGGDAREREDVGDRVDVLAERRRWGWAGGGLRRGAGGSC